MMPYCANYNSLQGCNNRPCKLRHEYVNKNYKTVLCKYSGGRHYYKCKYKDECNFAINEKEYYKWNILNMYRLDIQDKYLFSNE